MMAAYQPAPGGHPGLPHGHPGMAPQGQHMGQPMQMHPGVSGAPHVSQPGAMMGMQPGAQGMGPGGMGGQHPGGMGMQGQMGGQSMAGGMSGQQAMSHMTPQHAAMQAQQAQQMAAHMHANPQLAQQQQLMRMRQHQMMQQAQANGMMGGMQHQGGQMQLTPQQMVQIQQQQQQQAQNQQGGAQAVQLPQHLMQQQMQLHQQRQAQLAQQQQQNQMAQQLAMQHANSQQSNQGQPTPASSQGQPNNAQQIRPQSRMANPNEQTPGGQQQQHPQQGQGQPNQPQPQPTPQPGQAHPQQQGQQLSARQQQIAILQRQQLAHQRQQLAQSQAQQPQAAQGGMFILRLMNFSDHLSNIKDDVGKELHNWQSFVERHFAQDGRLIHSFIKNDPNSTSGTSSRVFEVQRPTIARYFWSYFDSGANSLRLHTEHAREVPHPSGSNQVICQNAIFSVSYPNGARLEMTGSLQVLFTAGTDSIEWLQFQISSTEDIVSRSSLEKVVSDFSPSIPTKSPKMAKSKLPKAQQKLQEQQDRLTMDHFPKTPKGTLGITSKVQHFLEIGETMNVMSDLMYFAQEKKMRPEQAMEDLVRQYDAQSNQQGGNGNPQINFPPDGVQRTPSMQSMQLPQNGQQGNFSSPNVANMNLPNGMNMNMLNSHTPSPHQPNMPAPAMMPQHSQQGTNSSAASANTSPNVNNNNNNNNKRRRSTVKLEGDDGGGPEGGNANRIKPSPQMRKKPKP